MITLGHIALIIALFACMAQMFAPVVKKFNAKIIMVSTFGLISFAFLSLVYSYAMSDFSVLNVLKNSHSLKPLIYKISGVWGNHEGSMMLWIWMLSLWGFFVTRSERLPKDTMARVLSVQGAVTFGFALFILLTSNPFIRIYPAPAEGMGLNPVLQDFGLALHPPLLYMGYVGFSIAFCFAIAGLIEKKIDQDWAKITRPWVLSAWVALTLGITAGSAWAYYELGWGGFWFWDPVENASLMPWIAGTALLHSIAVLEKREKLANWTIFLAILAFSLSLLGTFLVRSGVLTSVHSFASDPMRGMFILALLCVAIGGALFFFAIQAPKVKSSSGFNVVSRESVMLLNNVFLFTFCITVLLGTLYPLILNALDMGSISVGTPYYTMTMLPLLVPFVVLMGLSPYVSWGQGMVKKIKLPVFLTLLVLAAVFFMPVKEKVFSLVGIFMGSWIVFLTLYDFWKKRANVLTRSYLGMVIAHIGFGLMVVAITTATLWKHEKTTWMEPSDRIELAGEPVEFLGTHIGMGNNYAVNFGVFSVKGKTMIAEKRWYPVQAKLTSEVALMFNGFDVLYVVMGDQDKENPERWVVRAYYHPLALLILFGAIMIALGGFVSLLDKRRYE